MDSGCHEQFQTLQVDHGHCLPGIPPRLCPAAARLGLSFLGLTASGWEVLLKTHLGIHACTQSRLLSGSVSNVMRGDGFGCKCGGPAPTMSFCPWQSHLPQNSGKELKGEQLCAKTALCSFCHGLVFFNSLRRLVFLLQVIFQTSQDHTTFGVGWDLWSPSPIPWVAYSRWH